MFNEILKALKELSVSDRYLLGVAVLLLVNYQLAMLIAVVVVCFFIYRIVKKVSKALDLQAD